MAPIDASATSPLAGLPTAILGLGRIGGGLAEVVAEAGLPLVVWTRRPEAAARFLAEAHRRLARQVRRGRLSQAEADVRAAGLRMTESPADLGPVGLVIEAIAEDRAAKRALLGAVAGSGAAVLASTTSEIPLDALTEDADVARRLVGLHVLAPVRLTTSVELIPGPRTDPAAVALAGRWCRRIERDPHVFRRSVVNLVVIAYVAEGLQLCLEGADPAEVDQALVDAGFGLGPLATLDLIGLDVAVAVMDRKDELTPRQPEALRRIVQILRDEGHLGRKSGTGLLRHGDEEGVNPRFRALLPDASGPAPTAAACVRRVRERVSNELLACVAHELGPPGAMDAVLAEVFGLEEGALLGCAQRVPLPALQALEAALGGRYEPSSSLLEQLTEAAR